MSDHHEGYDRGHGAAGGAPARVLVVDDDGGLRQLVRMALEVEDRLHVVAEAADVASALDALAEHDPDLVILDLGLPDLNGVDVIERLRDTSSRARIVVFTGAEPADTEAAALAAGAAGYVFKDGDLDRLVEVLQGVAAAAPVGASTRLPASVEAIKEARRFVLTTCDQLACRDVSDDVALVTGELVANAVVHAHSESDLRVRRSGAVVRVEVTDFGPGMPEPQAPDLTAPNGRGLLIVSALSQAWGIDPDRGCKTVWAELGLSG